MDISGEGAAKVMVDALLARVSRLDMLVHCAVTMQRGSVEGMDLVKFDCAYKVNVRSPFALTQAALKALVNSLRDEIDGYGVRILSIVPGRTATPSQEQLFAAGGQPYRLELLLQPEDVAELNCSALLIPRTAEVRSMQSSPFNNRNALNEEDAGNYRPTGWVYS